MCSCSSIRPIFVILFLTISLWGVVAANSFAEEIRVFPGEYVIEANNSNHEAGTLSQMGASVVRGLGGNNLLVRSGVQLFGTTTGSSSIPFRNDDQFCARLLKSGAVRSCSPNFELRIDAVPADPKWGDLWGLGATKGIDAARAWNRSTGSDQMVVAVIDTGIDYRHPDLQANLWVNPGEIPGNGIDDDNNGYIDDQHGISAIQGSGDPFDENGHGTHVAGTIGGRGNNGIGVVGVNWKVKIMSLKFLSADGSGSLAGAVQALNYLVTMKRRGVNVRVANNSWGGGGYSAILYNAIQALNSEGVIFVAASGNAGNDNDRNPSYPASYDVPNVVSVAALDQNQNLASFSNYGYQSVDLAAPGVGILSTYPGNRYKALSGTSMATPHVTGALALLLSNAQISAGAAIQRLYESGSERAGLGRVVRTGRTLNVARMLFGETSPLPDDEPQPNPCRYEITQIPYDPDYSADTAALVQQSDELNFYDLELPFSFPFFNERIDQITISPNGLLYTNGAPSTMDYQVLTQAPLNSIAALHTDLLAYRDPQGVRTSVTADRAIIYWRAKHYGAQTSDDIELRSVLHKSGAIDLFLQVNNSTVENVLQDGALIGLTGDNLNTAQVYAHNSAQIRNGLALRFIPICSEIIAPDVSQVEAQGQNRRGRSVPRAIRRNPLEVYILGAGSGTVDLQLAFNRQVCPQTQPVQLTNGYAQFHTIMPRVSARYRTIEFRAGEDRAQRKRLRIKNRSVQNSGQVKRRNLSTRRLQRHCSELFGAMVRIQ